MLHEILNGLDIFVSKSDNYAGYEILGNGHETTEIPVLATDRIEVIVIAVSVRFRQPEKIT